MSWSFKDETVFKIWMSQFYTSSQSTLLSKFKTGPCFIKLVINNDQVPQIYHKSAQSQSTANISVAYNNYCFLLLITSFMKQDPDV